MNTCASGVKLPIFRLYFRGLSMLSQERWLATALAAAGLVLAGIQLAEPVLFGRVIDALNNKSNPTYLIALWAGLGLFGVFAGVIVAIYSDRMAHRRKHAEMANIFERAIALPQHFHAQRGSGAIIRAILNGSGALFWIWLSALREKLTALFGIVLLIPTALAIDYRMALILFALASTYTVLNVFVMRKTSSGQRSVESYSSAVSGRVGDVIGNVSVVQSYARLRQEADELRDDMQTLLAAQFPVLTWWGLLTVLHRSAATLTMVAILLVGANLARSGELSVGEIVSFVAFSTLLISRLDQLSSFFVQLHRHAPVLETYFSIVDAPESVEERADALPLTDVRGQIRFDHVSFKYPGGDQGIFDLLFEAKAGETTALVGPTGAGKSTTIALLQRFHDPLSGAITIDGHDLKDVTLDTLRKSIAVVFQDAGLFNRSIEENILVGKPSASNDEVVAAARLAEAHSFIVNKPDDYNFVIGERGLSLSGGERQRIALARAILKNAPVLILDEATSALDAETELRIKTALDTLRKNRTTIIIAHRLSTVASADQILVFDEGRVVERGQFTELAQGDGRFARMVADGGFTIPRSGDAG